MKERVNPAPTETTHLRDLPLPCWDALHLKGWRRRFLIEYCVDGDNIQFLGAFDDEEAADQPGSPHQLNDERIFRAGEDLQGLIVADFERGKFGWIGCAPLGEGNRIFCLELDIIARVVDIDGGEVLSGGQDFPI